jgi:hypothetical protein
MEHIPVSSSSIRSIAYDTAHQILEVLFCNDTRYHHHAVPHKLFQDFLAAPSHGAFYNRQIRGVYASQRVA